MSTRSREHPDKVLCQLVAIVVWCAMAFAAPAATLTVDTASVVFNPRKTDAFTVKGLLTGLDPQGVATVRVEFGGFAETIPIGSFVHRQGKLSFKGAKGTPGIATLTIDTVKGRFAVAAKGLTLKPFDDPAAFRLTAGGFDECATLVFSEAPKKWTLARSAPACGFASLPVVTPTAFFVNAPTDVRVQIAVLDDLALDLASMKVSRLDASLQPTGPPLCTLYDDGSPANGDTTAVDGIFSCRFTLSAPLPERIRLAVQALRDTTLVLSPSFLLDAVTPLTDPEIATVMAGQDAAGDIWDAVVAELGEGKKARKEAVARVLALPNVADAGVTADGLSIFIRYTNGLEAGLDLDVVSAADFDPPLPLSRAHAVTLSATVARAVERSPDAPRVGNNKVLLWSPFDDEQLLREAKEILKQLFEASICPKFEVTVLEKEQCTLASLATFPQYGTVVLLTHGAQPHKGGDIAFMSGEKATLFSEWYTHSKDIKLERLLIYNGQRSPEKKGYYVFYPSYLENIWTGAFPNTVVYAAACTGAVNRSMANPFLAKGAQAYLGMSDTVFGGFLKVGGEAFFKRFVGNASSAADAYQGVPYKTLKEYIASIGVDTQQIPPLIVQTLESKLTLLAGDDRVRYPCEPPPPGLIDTVTIQVGAMATALGSVDLESNATYRMVVTGTAHNQFAANFSDYDAIYCFASSSDFCNTPFPNADTLYFATKVGNSTSALENAIEFTGSFPPYAGSHRYEFTFTGKSGKLFLETWPANFPDDGVTRTGSFTVQLFRQ